MQAHAKGATSDHDVKTESDNRIQMTIFIPESPVVMSLISVPDMASALTTRFVMICVHDHLWRCR